MRLPDFILANIDLILEDWDRFALKIWPTDAISSPEALRDHAEAIIRAAVRDMRSDQSSYQQSEKSYGDGIESEHSNRLDLASHRHGMGRVDSGFLLLEVLSEYRALRASVIRLWRDSKSNADLRDLDDLTRFHESIDQSVAEAIRSYSHHIDESREMFLAILGHDLRTPLASIAFATTALARKPLDPKSQEMVTSVSSSAIEMKLMIRDLLDFATTRMGRGIPLHRAEMDLARLCHEVVAQLQSVHPARSLIVSGEREVGFWDDSRLRQVITNLVGNAVQHGSPDSPVVLSLGGSAAEVTITVHNEGTPIPEDFLPRLFAPMSRGVPHDTDRRSGSVGLGLYIANEIVKAHSGTINVTSTAESGTDFTVRLPRTV